VAHEVQPLISHIIVNFVDLIHRIHTQSNDPMLILLTTDYMYVHV